MSNCRTVGELREFISEIPDDVEVWGWDSGSIEFSTRHTRFGAAGEEDEKPEDGSWESLGCAGGGFQ